MYNALELCEIIPQFLVHGKSSSMKMVGDHWHQKLCRDLEGQHMSPRLEAARLPGRGAFELEP